ncbi:ArsA family ATPase [uncultured Fusobacterium sp.]|jgi:arsenite-transporting ATPase|uniref:ArsA family ATPase n=1 Tax=uncultured Fusobacterium sp. TaxID=159267 RepID=UPI00258890EF|nr:ArsA family ATPase [uncultured Fusobacterium sp.]
MRILFYTGKGGVGKTTISAVTGNFLASNGQKVLVMSTDQAHSLEDCFAKKLSSEPKEIYKNLYAMEIDPVEEGAKVWTNMQQYIREIIYKKANYGIEADEALMFPGFDEIFALLYILKVYEEKKYDVLIVDCAPTGQSLSMLTYAEKIQMIADAVIPMVKNINSIFGSFISKKTSVPKPKDIVFDEFSALVERLTKLYKILKNQEETSIRIVTTPEHIVIEEAKRNYTWLKLYGFNVDVIYLNKLYPAEMLTGYFSEWEKYQQESIEIVQESFHKQKIFMLELQNNEILGKEKLDDIGEIFYTTCNPLSIFTKTEDFFIEDKNGTRTLCIELPFVKDRDEISAFKDGNDIVISWLNETRRFHLPEKLRKREISDYIYEYGYLKIKMDY